MPTVLAAYAPVGLDGKRIKHAARQLRPMRGGRGHVLGGKILVAEDVRPGLAVALEADPAGDASDLALVPGLVPRARADIGGPRLWVGDALFAGLLHLGLLPPPATTSSSAKTRESRSPPEPERPARAGVNRRG